MTLPCKVGILIVSAALLHEDLDSLAPQKELGLYATATSEKNMAVVSGGKMAFVPLPLEDARDMERARTVRLQLRPLVVEAGEHILVKVQLSTKEAGVNPSDIGDFDPTAPGVALFKPPRVGVDEVFFVTLDPWRRSTPPRSLMVYVIPAMENASPIKSEFEIVSAILLP
jgi:hypothetical protein